MSPPPLLTSVVVPTPICVPERARALLAKCAVAQVRPVSAHIATALLVRGLLAAFPRDRTSSETTVQVLVTWEKMTR